MYRSHFSPEDIRLGRWLKLVRVYGDSPGANSLPPSCVGSALWRGTRNMGTDTGRGIAAGRSAVTHARDAPRHGGVYDDETPLKPGSLFVRLFWMLPPSKNFTIFEGTSEIQRMLIGRAVTGLDVR